MLGLLALFGDTVFFLVLASLGPERLLWLASAFFLYLLTEALVFYTSLELVVIARCLRHLRRRAAVRSAARAGADRAGRGRAGLRLRGEPAAAEARARRR